MNIGEIILQLMYAILAAGLVVIFARVIEQRRWLCVMVLLLFILIAFSVLVIPSIPPKLKTPVEIVHIVGTVLVIGLIVSISLYWSDSHRRARGKLFKFFKKWGKAFSESSAWEWRDIENVKQYEGLLVGSLPPLAIPTGYSVNKLTPLKTNKSLETQVAAYHIIQQEEYISWIDASYWSLLRKLAETGISVTIYIHGGTTNDFFYHYVKAVAGRRISVDTNVYDRLQMQEPREEPNDLQSSSKSNDSIPRNDATGHSRYIKLNAFARMLPLLLRCNHTLVLIWESYYSKYFSNNEDEDTRVISISGKMSDSESCEGAYFSLKDLRTEFLVAPTAIEFDDEGKKQFLRPEETFLLGEETQTSVYRRLKTLPTASIKCIVAEIHKPLLPLFERLPFWVICNILLAFRSDRSEGQALSNKDWSTKLLSFVLTKANHIIHYRIGKNFE